MVLIVQFNYKVCISNSGLECHIRTASPLHSILTEAMSCLISCSTNDNHTDLIETKLLKMALFVFIIRKLSLYILKACLSHFSLVLFF